MKRIVTFVCLVSLAGATAFAKTEEDSAIKQIDAMITDAKIDTSASDWKLDIPMPKVASFAEGKSYFADMKTTHGDVRLRLMHEVAPMHVTSFIYLSRMGFYDDLMFHRVITDFMAQGGCPLGTGTGGPGYKYAGEFDRETRHDRPGLLSMANAGPGTDGSQFFLTFKATPWLDGKHTIYGEVVEGMETLRALEKIGSSSGRTSEVAKIKSVTISAE